MHFESSATIDAEPATVWSVLTDLRQWPSWDSGVTSVDGDAKLDTKIKVEVEANPGKAFPVKVTELDAPRRMVFTGGMPLGLFKGERVYTLEPAGPGSTRFVMREEYTGPLRPLIGRTIPDLQPSFEQFASGLKQQAELRR